MAEEDKRIMPPVPGRTLESLKRFRDSIGGAIAKKFHKEDYPWVTRDPSAQDPTYPDVKKAVEPETDTDKFDATTISALPPPFQFTPQEDTGKSSIYITDTGFSESEFTLEVVFRTARKVTILASHLDTPYTVSVFNNNVVPLFYVDSNGKLVAGARRADTQALITLTSTTSVDDGKAHHGAVDWDGTTLKLYVDGTEEASSAPGVGIVVAKGKLIVGWGRSTGSETAGSRNFSGDIFGVHRLNVARYKGTFTANTLDILKPVSNTEFLWTTIGWKAGTVDDAGPLNNDGTVDGFKFPVSILGDEAYEGTLIYRSEGAPTNNPAPSSITTVFGKNGSLDTRLTGTYTQGSNQCDFLIFFRKRGTSPLGAPAVTDEAVAIRVGTGTFTWSYTWAGQFSEDNFSYGVAAARRTENGLEMGAIQSPTGAPDWQDITAGTPDYLGTIVGKDTHWFDLQTPGTSALDTTHKAERDEVSLYPTYYQTPGANKYILLVWDLTNQRLEYAHSYRLGATNQTQKRLVPATSGGGTVGSTGFNAGKFARGLSFVPGAGLAAVYTNDSGDANWPATIWAECFIKTSAGATTQEVLCLDDANPLAGVPTRDRPIIRILSGIPRATAWDGAAFVNAIGTTNIADGAFHHLAAAISGGSLRLYVNGTQEAATVTTATGFDTGGPATMRLVIGVRYAAGAWGGPFSGVIDEVRLSNIAEKTTNFTPTTLEYDPMDATGTFHPLWHFGPGLFGSTVPADTHNFASSDSDPADAMAEVLAHYSALAKDSSLEILFLVLSRGDGAMSQRLDDTLPDMIALAGGTRSLFASSNFRTGGAYILAGKANAGEGNGLEIYAGDTASSTMASAKMEFISADTQIVAVSGSGWHNVDVPGVPTNNITPATVTVTNRTDGSKDVEITWTYTQGELAADFFAVYWELADTVTPTQHREIVSPDSLKWIAAGVSQGTGVSLAVAAVRRTASGLQEGTRVTSATAPDWQGVGVQTPDYTANIDGKAKGAGRLVQTKVSASAPALALTGTYQNVETVALTSDGDDLLIEMSAHVTVATGATGGTIDLRLRESGTQIYARSFTATKAQQAHLSAHKGRDNLAGTYTYRMDLRFSTAGMVATYNEGVLSVTDQRA